MCTINELLRRRITLEVESLDRIYLNMHVPNLQVPGQLMGFLTHHRGRTIHSIVCPVADENPASSRRE